MTNANDHAPGVKQQQPGCDVHIMNENYPIFVHWYKTVDWILSSVERFPKNARFSLASKISNFALDTMELIVQAIYTRHRLRLLQQINLLLEQQRVLFRIAHDRRYISPRQHEHIANALNEAGCMIGGWRKETNEKNRKSV